MTHLGGSVRASNGFSGWPTSRGRAPWDGRSPPRVSVVIPTMNEVANLTHLFARMPDDVFEVIVVDARSSDGTIAVARLLRPDIRVVLQWGHGKGNALACGFAAARGDIIVTLDADGSMDPAEIDAFVRALRDGADFAKGSRFLPGGGTTDITRLRRWGNGMLSRLVNALYGTQFTDLCYGFNAFWAPYTADIHLTCDGFEVETLISLRFAKSRRVITEVASFEHQRLHGASSLRILRDGPRVLATIARERFRRNPVAARDDRWPPRFYELPPATVAPVALLREQVSERAQETNGTAARGRRRVPR
jgi:glycosyltransferase involved in cell wall biosynthesis